MRSIGIVGCGWLGSKIAQRLSGKFKIYVSTRTQDHADKLASLGYSTKVVDFSEEELIPIDNWDIVSLLDVVVVLVPFSSRKSTPESLKNKMNNLCKFIGDFNGQLFFASSTGVYPRKRILHTEDSLPINENAIERQIKQFFPGTNILRLAGLMGDDRLLSKYKVTGLEDPVNHVHYEDVCSVIVNMIEDQMHNKLYNVVAPLHPSKQQVIQAQLNNTMETVAESNGRIISSSKLIAELGFEFKYPDPRKFHE